MQSGDVDIGAARLDYAQRPVGTQAGYVFAWIDPRQRDRRIGEGGEQRVDRAPILGAPDMQRPQRRQHVMRAQARLRRAGQRLDARPAIGFRPERCRPTRRMVSRLILRLEQQYAGIAPDRRGKARAGDPCTDDGDVMDHAASRLARKASIRR